MENPIWIVVLTKSAYFRYPEDDVRELVSQWSTNHRAKVFGVSIDYKKKKKYFGLVRIMSATITYSKFQEDEKIS